MQAAALLFVVCALVASCYADGLPIKICDNANTLTESGIKVFNSTWTCTKEPCPIIKGKNLSILITITNNGDDIISLSNNVYGVVLGVAIPFPGYPDGMKNVCSLNSTSSSSCPIKKGAKYTEEVNLPIVKTAPNLQVIAKWELETSAGKEVGCFEVALQIAS